MKKSLKIICIIVIISATAFYLNGYGNIGAFKQKTGKDVVFFVATDTHYLASNLTDGGEAFQEFVNSGDGKELNYIHEIMDAFANDIRKKKPDVLIISGDLTSNGERESHLELARRLAEIEKTGTSVYVIPGNHDIFNPYARGFKGTEQYKTDYISSKDFSRIYRNFGYNEAISRDKSTLSYLAAPSGDVWLLMLDTALYENNLVLGFPQAEGRIAPGTIEWIKQCSDMAKANGARLVAVMHHNLVNHSEVVHEGFTVDNSKEAVKLFEQCGIDLALSGHIHLQDIKSAEYNGNAVYDIATSCIGIYPQKYGVLKYSPKSGMDYETSAVNVEGWAKETGIKDKNLVDFKQYSRKTYGGRIYSRTVSRLAITDDYSSEELEAMGDTYEELYLRYLEGVREVGTKEIKNSPGFKLWAISSQGFSQKNVMKLADTNGEDNNRLHIP